MKKKLGTAIESDILRRAKRRAADEDRPLSDLIQDALDQYLTAGAPTLGSTRRGLQSFLRTPDAHNTRAVP